MKQQLSRAPPSTKVKSKTNSTKRTSSRAQTGGGSLIYKSLGKNTSLKMLDQRKHKNIFNDVFSRYRIGYRMNDIIKQFKNKKESEVLDTPLFIGYGLVEISNPVGKTIEYYIKMSSRTIEDYSKNYTINDEIDDIKIIVDQEFTFRNFFEKLINQTSIVKNIVLEDLVTANMEDDTLKRMIYRYSVNSGDEPADTIFFERRNYLRMKFIRQRSLWWVPGYKKNVTINNFSIKKKCGDSCVKIKITWKEPKYMSYSYNKGIEEMDKTSGIAWWPDYESVYDRLPWSYRGRYLDIELY